MCFKWLDHQTRRFWLRMREITAIKPQRPKSRALILIKSTHSQRDNKRRVVSIPRVNTVSITMGKDKEQEKLKPSSKLKTISLHAIRKPHQKLPFSWAMREGICRWFWPVIDVDTPGLSNPDVSTSSSSSSSSSAVETSIAIDDEMEDILSNQSPSNGTYNTG